MGGIVLSSFVFGFVFTAHVRFKTKEQAAHAIRELNGKNLDKERPNIPLLAKLANAYVFYLFVCIILA